MTLSAKWTAKAVTKVTKIKLSSVFLGESVPSRFPHFLNTTIVGVGSMPGKKIKIVLLFMIPVLLLGYLAFRGFENSAAYYYTISEVLALETNGSKLRIKGELVEDSVEYNPELPLLKFSLTDGDHSLAVRYEGVLPDNFEHADEVIIEGKFSPEREFIVSKLMLQCPSKYEGEE